MSTPGDIFRPVTLTWQGKDYTVPPERCMPLAYKVELALRQDSGMSFFELAANPPVTGLSFAYGAALRFAGAAASDEEVHREMAKVFTGDHAMLEAATMLIDQIICLVFPPEALKTGPEGGSGDAAKKAAGG